MYDAVKQRWEQEQQFLGMSRDTPNDAFLSGGLAALALNPTVRIAVLPADPSGQIVPAEEPKTMIPQFIKLPHGRQLPYPGTARGTASGYVGYTPANDGKWRSFCAVNWHGGVDSFLGDDGGRPWRLATGSTARVIFLLEAVGWAWGAFDLQRQIAERFDITGPYRAILGVSHTAEAVVGNLGAGWAEPATSLFGQPTAVEPRVLLLEDLPKWPDEKGVEALALRFGARLDLAFGGSGTRHLDREGPETGRFNPRW